MEDQTLSKIKIFKIPGHNEGGHGKAVNWKPDWDILEKQINDFLAIGQKQYSYLHYGTGIWVLIYKEAKK